MMSPALLGAVVSKSNKTSCWQKEKWLTAKADSRIKERKAVLSKDILNMGKRFFCYLKFDAAKMGGNIGCCKDKKQHL
jgi:hypothetical protein